MPSLSTVPTLPTFTPSLATPKGLELLATAATVLPMVTKPTPPISEGNLSTPGPYNPTTPLPQRMLKEIIDLEFVKMAELTNDVWQDDLPSEPPNLTRRSTRRAPVTDISVWLECYSRWLPF